jgi:hypothetical protein
MVTLSSILPPVNVTTVSGTLAVTNGGTGVTTSTGTGSVVLSNSPTLVTPVLGAASATSVTAALGAVGTPSYTFTGDTNTGIYSPAADTIAFVEGGVEAMRITSAGDVGIGTASPNSAGVNRAITVNGTSNSIVEVNYGGTRGAYLFSNASGTVLSSVQNLRLQLNTNDTPRVTIDSSGNVGVGTDTPGGSYGRLTVAGGIRTVDDTSSKLELGRFSAGAPNSYIKLGANSASLRFTNAADDTDLMTLTNAGRFFIGATTGVGNDQMLVAFNSSGSITQAINMRDNNASGNGNSFLVLRRSDDTYLGAIGRSGTDSAMFVDGNSYLTLRTGGTERMRIIGSGYVGIGTTAPNGELQVKTAGGQWRIETNGAGTKMVGVNAADTGEAIITMQGSPITFFSNGSERMRITSDGNVGIGRGDPPAALSILRNSSTASVAASSSIVLTNKNTSINGTIAGGIFIDTYRDVADPHYSGGIWFTRNQTSGNLASGSDIVFGAMDNNGSNTLPTEDMRIVAANGNVGIGTSSPAARLTVSLAAGSVGGGQLIVKDPSHSGVAVVQGASGEGYLWNTSNNFLSIGTNNTERMRIDASGNVLVGTTTANAKTTIQQDGNAEGLRVSNFTASMSAVHQYSVLFGSGNKNTTAVHFGAFTQDANVFFVFGNGNVQNTNNSYGAISDIKFKENVVDATPKLDALMQVRVVNYNLKSQPDEKHIGVIAQELEEIFPGLVEEAPERDGSGELTSKTSKSVKYSVFVPMLIKALQEANGKIQELTARVAQLEGN